MRVRVLSVFANSSVVVCDGHHIWFKADSIIKLFLSLLLWRGVLDGRISVFNYISPAIPSFYQVVTGRSTHCNQILLESV